MKNAFVLFFRGSWLVLADVDKPLILPHLRSLRVWSDKEVKSKGRFGWEHKTKQKGWKRWLCFYDLAPF